MTSKEALDNLHRCALCYKSSNHDEWINHCRKVRNIIEKDLERLEKYKSIEEELGVDLITLFKAVKNDFYFKYEDKIISSNDYSFQTRENIRGDWVLDIISNNLSLLLIKLKDYGKTWALTKEELENE